MNLIKLRLKKIVEILPQEATTNNIMRHILKIIREEYDAGFKVRVIVITLKKNFVKQIVIGQRRGTNYFTPSSNSRFGRRFD